MKLIGGPTGWREEKYGAKEFDRNMEKRIQKIKEVKDVIQYENGEEFDWAPNRSHQQLKTVSIHKWKKNKSILFKTNSSQTANIVGWTLTLIGLKILLFKDISKARIDHDEVHKDNKVRVFLGFP